MAQLQSVGNQTCLSRAQLQGANLCEVPLQGAFLRDAQLQGAHLCNTQLQGACLLGAQLRGRASSARARVAPGLAVDERSRR